MLQLPYGPPITPGQSAAPPQGLLDILKALGDMWNRSLKPGQERLRTDAPPETPGEPPVKPEKPPTASGMPPSASPSGPVTVPPPSPPKRTPEQEAVAAGTAFVGPRPPEGFPEGKLNPNPDMKDIESQLENARDVTRAEDIGSMPEEPSPFDALKEGRDSRLDDIARQIAELRAGRDKDYGSLLDRNFESHGYKEGNDPLKRFFQMRYLNAAGAGGTGEGSLTDWTKREQGLLEKEKERDLQEYQSETDRLMRQQEAEQNRQYQTDLMEANRAWQESQQVPVTVGGETMRVSPDAYLNYSVANRQAEAQAKNYEAMANYYRSIGDAKNAEFYLRLMQEARLSAGTPEAQMMGLGAPPTAPYGPSMAAQAAEGLRLSQLGSPAAQSFASSSQTPPDLQKHMEIIQRAIQGGNDPAKAFDSYLAKLQKEGADAATINALKQLKANALSQAQGR